MNPENVVCVCKHNGIEVGRIKATDPTSEEYVTKLTRQYDGLVVDYMVEDPKPAPAINLLGMKRFW